MQHPLFGNIEWKDKLGLWEGRVQVDYFSNFDNVTSAIEPPQDELYKQGNYRLWLITEEQCEPSNAHEAAFRQFLDGQEAICATVVKGIFDFYQANRGNFWTLYEGRMSREQFDLEFPVLGSADHLKRLIRFQHLSVLQPPRNRRFGLLMRLLWSKLRGLPEQSRACQLGFCFHCCWDPEHGLGVVIDHDGTVADVGENDITW